MSDLNRSDYVVHKGGCHCGAVQFEFKAAPIMPLTLCNCSMCHMMDFQHIFVPEEDFTLLSGEEALSEYTFNTGAAKHLFCSICGVKSFYRPRSHPKAFSVNYRAIKPGTLTISRSYDFDGQNWEDSIDALREEQP